jgi:hypothetical protein
MMWISKLIESKMVVMCDKTVKGSYTVKKLLLNWEVLVLSFFTQIINIVLYYCHRVFSLIQFVLHQLMHT